MAQMIYTQDFSFNGKNRLEVTWNPDTEERDKNWHYFVVLRNDWPKRSDGTCLQFEYGAVSKNFISIEDIAAWFSSLMHKFPGYDWSQSYPAVVKSPCAFDAQSHFVFVADPFQLIQNPKEIG